MFARKVCGSNQVLWHRVIHLGRPIAERAIDGGPVPMRGLRNSRQVESSGAPTEAGLSV